MKTLDTLIEVLQLSSLVFVYCGVFAKIFIKERIKNKNIVIWRLIWMAEVMGWVPELINFYLVKQIYYRKWTKEIRTFILLGYLLHFPTIVSL